MLDYRVNCDSQLHENITSKVHWQYPYVHLTGDREWSIDGTWYNERKLQEWPFEYYLEYIKHVKLSEIAIKCDRINERK